MSAIDALINDCLHELQEIKTTINNIQYQASHGLTSWTVFKSVYELAINRREVVQARLERLCQLNTSQGPYR